VDPDEVPIYPVSGDVAAGQDIPVAKRAHSRIAGDSIAASSSHSYYFTITEAL